MRPLSPLWFAVLLCTLLIITFFLRNRVEAAAVISEVHWAGSDLSASDEWIEISSTDAQFSSMSGWTLTSLTSGGTEKTIFQFPAGATIRKNKYLIVSHYGTAQSRLLTEPAFIAPSMSLPNTQLLLKLKNALGEIMDQVDDGSGAPFVGESSTNPFKKASMERVDLSQPGTVASNWITSTQMVGWSNGQMGIFGSPGWPFVHSAISSSASFVSSSSLPQVGMPASSSVSSCPAVDPYFIIQSGESSGEEKVTINLQIGTHQGSLTGASCAIDFDDGTTSTSCNPPSHTYDEPGTFTITADVKTSCVNFTRTLPVEVKAKNISSSSSRSSPLPQYIGPVGAVGPFVISGVLPNPSGKDPGNEWVEITNTSTQSANLEGWSLRLPHTKKNTFTFGTTGFFFGETKHFSDAELGMTFKNETGELSLLNPEGQAVMTVSWKDAKEGVIQRPLRVAPSGTLRARVVNVIDGDTVEAQMLEGILRVERIRLIGIDAPELHSKDSETMMLGRRSAEFLRNLISGTIVTLTFGMEERDTYGRLLAYVEDEAGDSIQEQLLREGMASVYVRYPFTREAEFIGYQREAQEANTGMWGILQYEGDERLEIRDSELGSIQEAFSSSSSSRSRTVLLTYTVRRSSKNSPQSFKSSSSRKPKSNVVASHVPTYPRTSPAGSAGQRRYISAFEQQKESMSPEINLTPFSAQFDPLRELVEVSAFAKASADEPEANAAVSSREIDQTSGRSFPLLSITIAFILCAIAGCAGGWFLSQKFR